MKKLFAILICAALLFALCGCGGGNDPQYPEPQTAGEHLRRVFLDAAAAQPDATAEQLAQAVADYESIPYDIMLTPVQEGLLTGFGNNEITGFSDGVMFGPMIGAIPFVGYVFTLSEGTDAAGFQSMLESSADLRWNVCTQADEMVCGISGDKVFFVMCPESFEE